MKPLPHSAMVLAAGFGTRLRPLTDTQPKPLIEVGGQPVIFHTLQALAGAGLRRAVVNSHYHAALLEAAVREASRAGLFGVMEIVFSYEVDLLETGGGLKYAAPLLGAGPVLVVNSDAVWREQDAPLLAPLLAAWQQQPPPTQALLAVVPLAQVCGEGISGDFKLLQNGELNRDGARSDFTHVYGGVHVTETEKIVAFGMEKFSLNLIWEAMRAEHGLFGWEYAQAWAEMGTPAGLAAARALMER